MPVVAAALFLGRGEGGEEDRGGGAEVGKTYGGGGGDTEGLSSSQIRRKMGSPTIERDWSSSKGSPMPRDGRMNCLKRAKSPANSLMKAGIFVEACMQKRGMEALHGCDFCPGPITAGRQSRMGRHLPAPSQSTPTHSVPSSFAAAASLVPQTWRCLRKLQVGIDIVAFRGGWPLFVNAHCARQDLRYVTLIFVVKAVQSVPARIAVGDLRPPIRGQGADSVSVGHGNLAALVEPLAPGEEFPRERSDRRVSEHSLDTGAIRLPILEASWSSDGVIRRE